MTKMMRQMPCRNEVVKRFRKICDNLTPGVESKLLASTYFWGDETEEIWDNMINFVKNNVDPDSQNRRTVHIYAILYGCSDENMRRFFKTHGL